MTLREVLEGLPDEATLPVSYLRRLLDDGGGVVTRDGPVMLTVKETAQRLGMSSTYCYDHSAEIGAVHLGRAIRFPVEVVEEYLRRMQRDR